MFKGRDCSVLFDFRKCVLNFKAVSCGILLGDQFLIQQTWKPSEYLEFKQQAEVSREAWAACLWFSAEFHPGEGACTPQCAHDTCKC